VGDSRITIRGRAVAVVSFLEDRSRPAEVFTPSAGAFSPYRKADLAVCGSRRRKAAPVVAFELGIDGAATFTVGPAVQIHLLASPATPTCA
jgi:hypothetical protein